MKAIRFCIVTTILGLGLQAQAAAFSFADFMALATDDSVKNIDQFIGRLPEQMRENFTLIHTSHSLQEASHQYPRVLMFSADGTIMLTFNGHPSQRGYQSIELAQYRPESERLRMWELEFKEDKERTDDPLLAVMPEMSADYGAKRISRPNPAKCMACHAGEISKWPSQSNVDRIAVYNWKQYRDWPENFGSTDDYFFGYPNEYEYNPDRIRELDQLKSLRGRAPQMERYRHLIFGSAEAAPFCNPREIDEFKCRKNLIVTEFIAFNMVKQFASLKAAEDRVGVLNHLDHTQNCSGKSRSKTRYVFANGKALPRLLDPGFILRNGQTRETWSLGNNSLIYPGYGWADGEVIDSMADSHAVSIQTHTPAAIIRELAKSSSKFNTLYGYLSNRLYSHTSPLDGYFKDVLPLVQAETSLLVPTDQTFVDHDTGNIIEIDDLKDQICDVVEFELKNINHIPNVNSQKPSADPAIHHIPQEEGKAQ